MKEGGSGGSYTITGLNFEKKRERQRINSFSVIH